MECRSAFWLIQMPPLKPLASLPASRPPTATGPGQAPAKKIAIPRLKIKPGSDSGFLGSANRQRVTQACGPCRQRKSKCTGDKSACRQCLELNISCYYPYGKLERAEKCDTFLNSLHLAILLLTFLEDI